MDMKDFIDMQYCKRVSFEGSSGVADNENKIRGCMASSVAMMYCGYDKSFVCIGYKSEF